MSLAAGPIANDAHETVSSGAMNVSGWSAYVGSGYTPAFRFIGVPIPRGDHHVRAPRRVRHERLGQPQRHIRR